MFQQLQAPGSKASPHLPLVTIYYRTNLQILSNIFTDFFLVAAFNFQILHLGTEGILASFTELITRLQATYLWCGAHPSPATTFTFFTIFLLDFLT